MLEILKLMEGNIGNALHDIGIGKDFLNRTPSAPDLKPTIEQ